MTDYILAGVIIVLLILLLLFCKKSRHGFAKFLFGTLSGIILLYPASLLVTQFSGVLTLNIFTFCVSGVLGIPGVAILCICALL